MACDAVMVMVMMVTIVTMVMIAAAAATAYRCRRHRDHPHRRRRRRRRGLHASARCKYSAPGADRCAFRHAPPASSAHLHAPVETPVPAFCGLCFLAICYTQ